jgi:predicted nucleic acid-binding protein
MDARQHGIAAGGSLPLMRDLVVDSSVAIKWFLPDPYTAEARRILEGYRRGEITFAVPDQFIAARRRFYGSQLRLQS